MLCIKCGKEIINRKSIKYCSNRCADLYYKKIYRVKHIEKIKEYNRNYRRPKNGGNRPIKNPAEKRLDKCLKCGSENDLQLAHVKPLWAGGDHQYLITLCRTHHHEFDNALRDFWQN